MSSLTCLVHMVQCPAQQCLMAFAVHIRYSIADSALYKDDGAALSHRDKHFENYIPNNGDSRLSPIDILIHNSSFGTLSSNSFTISYGIQDGQLAMK